MKKVISFKTLIVFFLMGFLLQSSAIAQQNETLQAKVEKLQQKVSQLENRVAELEKILLSDERNSSLSKSDPSSKRWENKQNWRKLEREMSEDEVRKILGEPADIMATSSATYWTYPNGGRVTFYDNEVDGWREP